MSILQFPVRPRLVGERDDPSVGFVSTYPPTQCGLATFAAALERGLRANGVTDIGVVRCGSSPEVPDRPGVVAHLEDGLAGSVADAAYVLNTFDCVVVQHEYGIFGGPDGSDVLDLLDAIRVPVITTLHTVPVNPSPRQRSILEAVVARSDVAVTMTASARERLLAMYDVHPLTIATIPHGATLPPRFAPSVSAPATVLTWGLLGPGKGIEWVIDALAEVSDVVPPITYLVAGETHPKVRERHGEAYRESLVRRAVERGVADRVVFDQRYRSVAELVDLAASVAAVVLPYESSDQVTSGVLVDAVAAGTPVVSTRFPHSEELLGDGAGIVVPHRDPTAIARALRTIVTRPNVADAMRVRARQLAERHSWNAVAAQYLQVMSDLIGPTTTERTAAVSR